MFQHNSYQFGDLVGRLPSDWDTPEDEDLELVTTPFGTRKVFTPMAYAETEVPYAETLRGY